MGHSNHSIGTGSRRFSLPFQFFCGRYLESDYISKHYPKLAERLERSPAEPAPLLDSNGQSSAQGDAARAEAEQQARVIWSRKQKRQYQRHLSWLTEAQGRNCQILRIDLTTAAGGDSLKLRRDFQELKRRVKRKFGITLENFTVETSEGNGVLHITAAVEQKKAVWIPQSWLSEQWELIHGAKIASIKRMGSSKGDRRRVAKYMVTQYLVQQGDDSGSALVRYSWSWWQARVLIGRGWTDFKRIVRFMDYRLDRDARRDGSTELSVRQRVPWRECLQAWENLLTHGFATLADRMLVVEGRRIIEMGAVAKGVGV